jgi:hypothetical protein
LAQAGFETPTRDRARKGAAGDPRGGIVAVSWERCAAANGSRLQTGAYAHSARFSSVSSTKRGAGIEDRAGFFVAIVGGVG